MIKKFRFESYEMSKEIIWTASLRNFFFKF